MATSAFHYFRLRPVIRTTSPPTIAKMQKPDSMNRTLRVEEEVCSSAATDEGYVSVLEVSRLPPVFEIPETDFLSIPSDSTFSETSELVVVSVASGSAGVKEDPIVDSSKDKTSSL